MIIKGDLNSDYYCVTRVTEIKMFGNWIDRIQVILDSANVDQDKITNITVYYDIESCETVVNIRESDGDPE